MLIAPDLMDSKICLVFGSLLKFGILKVSLYDYLPMKRKYVIHVTY